MNTTPIARKKQQIAGEVMALWREHAEHSATIAHVTACLLDLVRACSDAVVSALLRTLRDEDVDVRRAAAQALGGLGAQAARDDVVVALLDALRDRNQSVRDAARKALRTLGVMGPFDEVIAAFLDLRDEDWFEPTAVAKMLAVLRAATASSDVVDALRRGLRDRSEQGWLSYIAANALGLPGRKAMVSALRKLGAVGMREEALAVLLLAPRDGDGFARAKAAAVLGALGEAGARNDVIAALLHILRDKERDVRDAASEALGALMDKGVRVFAENNGSWHVRLVADLATAGSTAPRRHRRAPSADPHTRHGAPGPTRRRRRKS